MFSRKDLPVSMDGLFFICFVSIVLLSGLGQQTFIEHNNYFDDPPKNACSYNESHQSWPDSLLHKTTFRFALRFVELRFSACYSKLMRVAENCIFQLNTHSNIETTISFQILSNLQQISSVILLI